MYTPYLKGDTLDDLMRSVIEAIRASGELIHPSKGDAKELRGVLLELTNPRARLSRTETKGKPFSCLGELCWYLSRTNDLGFIEYYLSAYKSCADGSKIFGGYGPRLFDWDGLDQMAKVIDILKNKPDSRQAVIQLFDRYDIADEHKDVPCTCTLQFMLRSNKLELFTNMRSNDVLKGLSHDVFCFTMLQEIVAADIGVQLGTYKHAVGSLHIYEESRSNAESYENEGWQATGSPMPPMPVGNPWNSVEAMLQAENALRVTGTCDYTIFKHIDPYWSDLIRLLHVFRCKQNNDADTITQLRSAMASEVYDPYINKVLDKLS